MIPGKTRHIGRAVPGSERFERLVTERYGIAQLSMLERALFLERAQPWGSLNAYNRWLAAYRANEGAFLDHVVWGADRDLGEGVYLYGAMDDRYATNAARVFVAGGLDVARDVEGKRACVVGAWDGTEALLLHALGATAVDTIEEVEAFDEMARLQLSMWRVPGESFGCSLYEVLIGNVRQRYDLVYVPGVLYHLTDLPAALVILWSMLRPGGVLVFESIVDPPGPAAARYLGPSRPGWNWWAPTANCFEALLRDCGFPDGHTVEQSGGRGWWMGTAAEDLPALRGGAAGFSRPDILRSIEVKK